MNVLNLDDHLPPEDRDSAALLRREAERVDGGRGPDLDDVLLIGRGRVLRRRLAGLGAAVAVAAVVLAASLTVGASRERTLPAQPAPEVTVTSVERSPAQFYADVDAALADAGVSVAGPLRWGVATSPQNERTGFGAETYVPDLGATLRITSTRGDAPAEDGEVCEPLVAMYEEAGDTVTCEEGTVGGGRLVTLTRESWTTVGFIIGGSEVTVDSDLDTFGVGPQLANPSPVPEAVLVELATDPRLRW